VSPQARSPRPRQRSAIAAEATNRAPIFIAVGLIALILGIGLMGGRGGSSADSADTQVASGSIEPLSLGVESTTTLGVPPTVSDAEPTLPPVTRTLKQGLAGDDVKMLQERLVDLGFDPGPADGIFGTLTTQSVWAFEKLVLKTPRTEASGAITIDSWDLLRDPELTIAPRRSTNGQADHTEVYLPEQVMIVFHQDKPALISHISSGEINPDGSPKEYCETATYDTDAQGRELEEPVTKEVCALSKTPGGVFTYDRQVTGKRVSPLGGMWDPVYFNYGIAVHGAENVPNRPASHGCVRLPMHISSYFQDVVDIGERILVWNGEKEPEQVTDRESLPSFDYADPNATTTTTSTTSTTSTTVPPTTAAPAPTTTKPKATTTTTTTTSTTTTTTTSTLP
jgi:peptidoglycan hydrolase-like protein with peptidoglycan-binding domain